MALFVYEGTGQQGERRSGELEAANRNEALRRLTSERIQPLSLIDKADAASLAGKKPATGAGSPTASASREQVTENIRLTNAQVILFTEELSDFLNSGLQLEPALQLMENREDQSPVKTVAAFLRKKVRDGTSFSEALKVASPNFGELYANLVAAGEVSGALAPLLRRQAVYLVAMQDLRNRVVLALIYPAVLVLAGLLAMIIFMTVLVPQMTTLVAKSGGNMPLPTYILMTLSQFVQHEGLLVGAALALLITGFVGYIRQPAGRTWWDETKLKIPLLGSLLRASFYAQFCQTMANLLQNGLPLLPALKLTSRATSNVYYRALILQISDLVSEGASLTRAMKAVGDFPPTLRDLVKVGEQTGELGETMEKVGRRYEKMIQHQIDRIMSIVPLIVIAALGCMVLLIAWSMLSAIFKAMQGIQMHH
jgi:type II secretory pathway component PulF